MFSGLSILSIPKTIFNNALAGIIGSGKVLSKIAYGVLKSDIDTFTKLWSDFVRLQAATFTRLDELKMTDAASSEDIDKSNKEVKRLQNQLATARAKIKKLIPAITKVIWYEGKMARKNLNRSQEHINRAKELINVIADLEVRDKELVALDKKLHKRAVDLGNENIESVKETQTEQTETLKNEIKLPAKPEKKLKPGLKVAKDGAS